MAFTRIGTVIVRVRDISAATEWYTDVLGFSVGHEDPAEGLAVLRGSEGSSLTLWEWKATDRPPAVGSPSCYPGFATTHAVEDAAALKARGIRTETVIERNGVRSFHFYDPDGNMLEAREVLA